MRQTPCRECPFRRKSLKGYIGGHVDPSEITDIVWSDRKFPCHMEVSKLTENGTDFDDACEQSFPCVGASITLENGLKLSRHPEVAEMQRHLERSDTCFNNRFEFEEYHRRKPNKNKRQKARKS